MSSKEQSQWRQEQREYRESPEEVWELVQRRLTLVHFIRVEKGPRNIQEVDQAVRQALADEPPNMEHEGDFSHSRWLGRWIGLDPGMTMLKFMVDDQVREALGELRGDPKLLWSMRLYLLETQAEMEQQELENYYPNELQVFNTSIENQRSCLRRYPVGEMTRQQWEVAMSNLSDSERVMARVWRARGRW